MAAVGDSTLTRRSFLSAFGGTLASAMMPAWAGEKLIESLIARAQAYPAISKRIDMISRALVGHRYQANTLIGGPRKKEAFVVRDDRFDCVTFCETVLAAATAHDMASFEAGLRAIRYRNGIVEWRARNHDFAAWCENNTANGFFTPVTLGEPVEIKKTLTAPGALGRRSYTIAAIPCGALLAEKDKLQDGDIIGFISRRASLDYFHTGFAIFGAKGELLLRHAAESHGRVVDQRMGQFLAINRTRYVTVLRAQGEGRKS